MGTQHLEDVSEIVCPFISGEVFVTLYVIFCHVCEMIFKLAPVKLKKEIFTQVIHHRYQDFSSAFSIQGNLGSQEPFVLKIASHFRRPCAKNTKKPAELLPPKYFDVSGII